MIRHNRLLVAFHVVSDALLGLSAFIVAYALRFQTGLIPISKGIPPLRQYINILPFVVVAVPLGFYLQGLYRLRRGRSRVDDFFAVFVGSILAVLFGMMSTIYVETYIVISAKDTGALEYATIALGNRKAFSNAASQGLAVTELKPEDPKAVEEMMMLYRYVFDIVQTSEKALAYA